MDILMPDNRSKPGKYGEPKQKYQFLLTPTASEIVNARASALGITRAEFLERSIRWLDEHWDTQLQREIGEDRHEP